MRESVKSIKDMTDPDVLRIKKPEWNTSNAVGNNKPADESHSQNLFNVTIIPIINDLIHYR